MYRAVTPTSQVDASERKLVQTYKQKNPSIVMLINSPVYFLDWAMIVFESKGYRLVVRHRDDISTDQYYDSLKGAKIAFIKSYSYLAHNKKYRPEWSHQYMPAKKWLTGRLTHPVKYN